MKLSVFGIGYVGCVSAACFAKEGHDVTGVDVNPTKVEIINSGNSPIVEPGIGELMQEAVASRRLRATTSAAEAVNNSEVSLVCVGTPSNANGSFHGRVMEMGLNGRLEKRARDSANLPGHGNAFPP